MSMIPNALDQVDAWCEKRRETGHLLLALDFDGTIAPIVARPDDASMLRSARAAIEGLRDRRDTDVAIVSGRALDDLKERCAIDGLYYAGNHGLEIEGPGVHETRQDALDLESRIKALGAELAVELANLSGAYVEDKQLTVSVHTRTLADQTDRARVRLLVRSAVRRNPAGVKITYGKEVIEIRPDIDWDKGKATNFLISSLSHSLGYEPFPLFIGDDATDEDAFAELREIGAGILVADTLPEITAATAYLASIDEVVMFLETLNE